MPSPSRPRSIAATPKRGAHLLGQLKTRQIPTEVVALKQLNAKNGSRIFGGPGQGHDLTDRGRDLADPGFA